MCRRSGGFTLIELSITVAVVGVLAAIALPNFFHLKENSERASCVVNQRHTVEATTLYIIETNTVAAVLNVTDLWAAGYINPAPGECPSEHVIDANDYTVTVAGGAVATVGCLVHPAEHFWDNF